MFVYMLLCDGFEESEAVVTADILARGGINVKFVSPYDKFKAVGSHGFVIDINDRFNNPDYYDHRFDDADAVILPGGKIGTENLRLSMAVKAMVREYCDSGKIVAAICAAPIVLGAAGILLGRKYTCYPGFEKSIKNAEYTGTPFEIDGNIVTGRSMGCSLEFGLALLEKLKDKETATNVEMALEMP
ncbi:MAG: DJ-1/PfpI family protein [Lachnospiraceae bacterium]|nr:DJ-1/PfpI family protein [Lachnospiraceae bacterium]